MLNYTFEADAERKQMRLPHRVNLGSSQGKLELPGQKTQICTEIQLRLLVLFHGAMSLKETHQMPGYTRDTKIHLLYRSVILRTGCTVSLCPSLCLCGAPVRPPGRVQICPTLLRSSTSSSKTVLSQRYVHIYVCITCVYLMSAQMETFTNVCLFIWEKTLEVSLRS